MRCVNCDSSFFLAVMFSEQFSKMPEVLYFSLADVDYDRPAHFIIE